MATVHLPRSLVAMFPAAPRHLEVSADDMAALVTELDVRYPGMWDRLCEPGPQFREHINAFVDGHRVTIEASLTPASVVHIIPAVSGGAQAEAERVHAESVGEWHAWLAANHERVDGVWLVPGSDAPGGHGSHTRRPSSRRSPGVGSTAGRRASTTSARCSGTRRVAGAATGHARTSSASLDSRPTAA